MYKNIIDQMDGLIEREVENLGGDLGQLENMIMEKVRVLGQGLLQRVIERGPRGYHGSSIYCSGCGGSMKFMGYRRKEIQTLLGWISVSRAYYYCGECGAGIFPYDQKSGLGSGQLSPGLSKACGLLATDDSFEESSRKVEELVGQKVSDDTIERLVTHVGSVVLKQEEKEQTEYFVHHEPPVAVVEPKRLYICPDGTTVHEEDGWHEVKMGCIYWQNDDFTREKRYVGDFGDSEHFGWKLWHESCRCGLRETDEVVFLGDGAPWIRTEHERHFRRAVFIIDWYHASKHLWDCGKALFGEETLYTAQWVKKRKNWLWKGLVEKLLWDLEKQLGSHGRLCPRRVGAKAPDASGGEHQKALEDLIRYIRTNKEQMRYDQFRKKGYDIGSGAVEGACKHVVGKRLKGSGMIWSRKGSSSTLALRIIWLNREWEQLWKRKPLAA